MLPQTEQNNTKHIFTKSKSTKELMKNQKTSTDDPDELPSKSSLKKENTQTDLSLEAPKKVKNHKSNLKKKSDSQKNHKKKDKKVKIIRYDLTELKNKINEINSKIENEKNISINNYISLNSEIKIKISKIKNLSLEQMELISKLKIIKDQLNNKLTNGQFFYILNERLAAGRSTIISTNLSPEEIRAEYSERIFSRIVSCFDIILILGDDIRIKKAISGY